MGKIVKLIGDPVEQSVSPEMQNKAFEELSRRSPEFSEFADWEYKKEKVHRNELEKVVEELRNDKNIAGFNVTVPYKEDIFDLLQKNKKDKIDESAKLIGAVNTVVKEKDQLIGYNTDGKGFIQSLKEDAGFDPKDKKVVVLGTGGGGRAAVTHMLSLKENRINFLVLKDIKKAKALRLGKDAKKILDEDIKKNKNIKLSAELNIPKIVVNPTNLQKHIDDADLLVNATSLGTYPKKIDRSPLPDNIKLPSTLLVYDLVYNPAKTKLMKAATKSCSGLGMLVHQGALAFELWTGQKPDIEVMRKAAKKALH